MGVSGDFHAPDLPADDDGYDIETIYRLEWPEKRPGAWVRARAMGTGEMLDFSLKFGTDNAGRMTRSDLLRAAIDLIVDVVVEWSFRHTTRTAEGPKRVPVPVTVEGVRMLDTRLLLDIYSAYLNDSVEVPEGSDLGKDSPSGDSYPAELTAAMEPLSPSPENSGTPTP